VKVQVGPAQPYRPGEDVVALLEARSPSGKPVEAALGWRRGLWTAARWRTGRVRTLRPMAHCFYAWSWHRGGTDELAGRTRQGPVSSGFFRSRFSEDLDLLAEVMLAYDPYWPNVETSVDYTEQLHQGVQSRSQCAAEGPHWRRSKRSLTQKTIHHQQDLQDLGRDLLDAGH